MDAIQAKVIALALTGQADALVVIRETPYLTEEEHGAGDYVVICPWGAEQNPAGSNAREDWLYPTMIAIVGLPDANSLDARLYRRQQIRNSMHNNPLTGVSNGTFIDQTMRPGNIVDVLALNTQKRFVSVLMHYCDVQEARS
jgi:hypothetical protein